MPVPPDWSTRRRGPLDEAELEALVATLDPEHVHALLVTHRWRWASSARYQTPDCFHSYSIRERHEWTDLEFEAVIRFIHGGPHSELRRFGGALYWEYVDPLPWPPGQHRFVPEPFYRWFVWSMGPTGMDATTYSPYTSVLNRRPLWARELRPQRRRREQSPLLG